MRSVVVILVVCALILLAFSSVWLSALEGTDRNIVDSSETSFATPAIHSLPIPLPNA